MIAGDIRTVVWMVFTVGSCGTGDKYTSTINDRTIYHARLQDTKWQQPHRGHSVPLLVISYSTAGLRLHTPVAMLYTTCS